MPDRWHRRAHRRLRHSLRWRLVALFLLLALALAGAFIFGMQKALGTGWREAARPLLTDYVDRLAAEIGDPPDVARAQALAARLPVTVRISGPRVQWRSGNAGDESAAPWNHYERWHGDDEPRLLARTTADGHRIEFGLNLRPWRDRPRLWGWATLAVLLALTALAYRYVRRLLRPLDDIRAGAGRFGRGDFLQPIPVRRSDELGDLAQDVNAMAQSIHRMLEAKRALLLAISHELRSPITRARLNAELLPESGDAGTRRAALLRDLQEMTSLVADLLESERLGQGHAALQREPTDLAALVREVAASFGGGAPRFELVLAEGLPVLALDRARMRLLLRNLLDNALRHGMDATQAPLVRLAAQGSGIVLTVRDHGPGVEAAVLPQLAEPFYRPDSARERASGGVGLGLYLSRMVAQAHGGGFALENAGPGLRVTVVLPS
ncbi:HAMP domain-containing sensor histidine kinase [Ramlibacter sp.]|uniref:sensor histidine kinase n=1 Tax=Ramlibacter sp. TaxID=1917967 RepID=UPI001812F504|nr:HAMP domain-containing sensor histidine kinase [Ramlibacter sp.]MBA2675432.1 HAMP domain-containing histidine kinase [Ramlibacter sp.]